LSKRKEEDISTRDRDKKDKLTTGERRKKWNKKKQEFIEDERRGIFQRGIGIEETK